MQQGLKKTSSSHNSLICVFLFLQPCEMLRNNGNIIIIIIERGIMLALGKHMDSGRSLVPRQAPRQLKYICQGEPPTKSAPNQPATHASVIIIQRTRDEQIRLQLCTTLPISSFVLFSSAFSLHLLYPNTLALQ